MTEPNLSRDHDRMRNDALYMAAVGNNESDRAAIIRLWKLLCAAQDELARLRVRDVEHGWADTMRQQERSGGTM